MCGKSIKKLSIVVCLIVGCVIMMSCEKPVYDEQIDETFYKEEETTKHIENYGRGGDLKAEDTDIHIVVDEEMGDSDDEMVNEEVQELNKNGKTIEELMDEAMETNNTYAYNEVEGENGKKGYRYFSAKKSFDKDYELNDVMITDIDGGKYSERKLSYNTDKYKLGKTKYTFNVFKGFEKQEIDNDIDKEEVEKGLIAILDNKSKLLHSNIKKILIYQVARNGISTEGYVRSFTKGHFGDFIFASFKSRLAATCEKEVVLRDKTYNAEHFIIYDDTTFLRIAFCYEGKVEGVGFAVMNTLVYN